MASTSTFTTKTTRTELSPAGNTHVCYACGQLDYNAMTAVHHSFYFAPTANPITSTLYSCPFCLGQLFESLPTD